MNNPFNHYYLFEEVGYGSNRIKNVFKTGIYGILEDVTNPMNMFKLTIVQPLFLQQKQASDSEIINPFGREWIGLTHFNNCQDNIIVIGNPKLKRIEFFISEKTKENAVVLYELVMSKKLDGHIADFRALANKSLINFR